MEYLVYGLLAGLIIGTIPAISGAIKGKLKLGFGAFAACTVSGIIFGLLLAVPVSVLFMYLIFKPDNQPQTSPTPYPHQADNPNMAQKQSSNDTVTDKIAKLSDLKHDGILTDEEFEEKKTQLLSK